MTPIAPHITAFFVSVRPYQVGPRRRQRRSAIDGCETRVGLDPAEQREAWPVLPS